MRITCPACQASYEIPDHLLVQTPERLRCARCGAEWAWARARALAEPEEDFELPDLFSDVPPLVQREIPDATPDLSLLADPSPMREPPAEQVMLGQPVGSHAFDVKQVKPLSPPPPFERLVPERPPDTAREAPELPPAEVSREAVPPLETRASVTAVEIPKLPFPKASPGQADRRVPEKPTEIPQPPRTREPRLVAASRSTVSDLAHERAMNREETFRRVIETTRQRSLAVPPPRSRRPQIIAVLSVLLLIALIFGVHYAMVHGLASLAG